MIKGLNADLEMLLHQVCLTTPVCLINENKIKLTEIILPAHKRCSGQIQRRVLHLTLNWYIASCSRTQVATDAHPYTCQCVYECVQRNKGQSGPHLPCSKLFLDRSTISMMLPGSQVLLIMCCHCLFVSPGLVQTIKTLKLRSGLASATI